MHMPGKKGFRWTHFYFTVVSQDLCWLLRHLIKPFNFWTHWLFSLSLLCGFLLLCSISKYLGFKVPTFLFSSAHFSWIHSPPSMALSGYRTMTPWLISPSPNLHQNFPLIYSTVFMTCSHSHPSHLNIVTVMWPLNRGLGSQLSRKLDTSFRIPVSTSWQPICPSAWTNNLGSYFWFYPLIYMPSSINK